MITTPLQEIVQPSKLPFITLFVIILLSLSPTLSSLHAQNYPAHTFRKVVLKDTSTFIGEVLSSTKDSLVFKNTNEEIIRLHRSAIKRSKKVLDGEFKDGHYRPRMVNNDKGFVAPHGFGLKKGEVYYDNTLLAWNELNAGLTDYLSLKLGFETITLADRISSGGGYESTYEPLFFISTKFALPVIKDKWNIGITTAIANIPNPSRLIDYGGLFISNTIGNKNNNVTFGIGAQVFGDGGAFDDTYASVSAHIRVGPKSAFTTEHWLVTSDRNGRYDADQTLFNTIGLKILGSRQTWSISIGTARELNGYNEGLPVILVGFAVPISSGKDGWKS